MVGQRLIKRCFFALDSKLKLKPRNSGFPQATAHVWSSCDFHLTRTEEDKQVEHCD